MATLVSKPKIACIAAGSILAICLPVYAQHSGEHGGGDQHDVTETAERTYVRVQYSG